MKNKNENLVTAAIWLIVLLLAFIFMVDVVSTVPWSSVKLFVFVVFLLGAEYALKMIKDNV